MRQTVIRAETLVRGGKDREAVTTKVNSGIIGGERKKVGSRQVLKTIWQSSRKDMTEIATGVLRAEKT